MGIRNHVSGINYSLSVILSVCLLLLLFPAVSCSSFEKGPDLKGIDAGIEIYRLEKDLFAIDIDSIEEKIPFIREKYGDFFDIFTNMVIRIGDPGSPSFPGQLFTFLTDFDIYRLHAEVAEVLPDLSETESEMDNAFRRYLYYFPEYDVPKIYTFVSGFNQSVVTAEGMLGIGLDKYLGSDHIFYSQLQLPAFRRQNMYPAKIPSDCMIAWAMTEFEYNDGNDNLLSNMIYQGRLLYFAEAMLPGHHDSIRTGFTSSQLEWCVKNETQMWTHLVENKLLFSTDARTISRFINEGPFTADFTRDSPSRAVTWLGWQIVKSYMKRNRDVTLEELMLDTDYRGILHRARYRP